MPYFSTTMQIQTDKSACTSTAFILFLFIYLFYLRERFIYLFAFLFSFLNFIVIRPLSIRCMLYKFQMHNTLLLTESPMLCSRSLEVIHLMWIFPARGNSNPLQYSCLEKSLDAGAWQATSPWGRKESGTIEQLYFHFCFMGVCCHILATVNSAIMKMGVVLSLQNKRGFLKSQERNTEVRNLV